MMTGYIVILITVNSEEQAGKIAQALVEKKLAACANIIGGIKSIYHWQGKICEDAELLLVVKTREELFGEVEKEVKRLHTYKVPEIIALPIIKGSNAYLQWISESTA